MNRWSLSVAVPAVALCLIQPVPAGDLEDVREAVLAYYAALNAGNVDGWLKFHLPERTSFGPEGGLLVPPLSLEEQRKGYQAQVRSGRRYNLQARHGNRFGPRTGASNR